MFNIEPEAKYRKFGARLKSGKRYFRQVETTYREVEIPPAFAKDGTCIRSAGHTMLVPIHKTIIHRRPSLS